MTAVQEPTSPAGLRGTAAVLALLREREFAGLLVSGVLSDVGNYVARVAIATLMLEATGSALLAAVVFALSVLPTVVGDAAFGPVADRWPRRTVMVVCDVVRAVLVGLLLAGVAAGAPLAVLLVLLFLVELGGAPFNAAYPAVVAEVLPEPDRFLVGNATLRVVTLVDQVLGLAVGGVVVALLSVEAALWLDLATFVASAVLLAACLRARPAATSGGLSGPGALLDDVRLGWRYLADHEVLRSLMLLAWSMSVTFAAPVALGLAYAAEQGRGPGAGSLLLACFSAGAAVGAVVATRQPHVAQVRRILPAAAGSALVLLLGGLSLDVPLAAAVWAGSGLLSGVMMMPLLSTFTLLSPPEMRGRLNGLAGSGFAAASTAGYLLAGGLADVTSPSFAVAVCAALGCLASALAWPRWPRRGLRRSALMQEPAGG